MNTATINGRKFVLVPVDEYELLQAALPPMPTPDVNGNVDAFAYGNASIVRTIVRQMRAAGLTQNELAESAGIEPAVLSRAIRGTSPLTIKALQKIEASIANARRTRPQKLSRR